MERAKNCRRRVSVWGTTVAAVAIFISSCAPIHAQQACVSPEEMSALEARILQTELMVAALTCKNHQLYNNFVRSHSVELQSMDLQLRNMFARISRSSKGDNLGQLVTRIANESAIRAANSRDAYCQEMDAVFDLSRAARPGQLASLTEAQPSNRRHNVQTCQAQVDPSATAGAGAISTPQ